MADQQDEPQAMPLVEEKQCRICLDGPDITLGRLIRPCLCKGSMSYVHVGCLKRWMASSTGNNFFTCTVCHYRYRVGRTRFAGIASNPVVVGALSSIFFTILVFCASFITTYFMRAFEEPPWEHESEYFYFSYHMFPFDVGKDLIRAAIRILKDRDALDEKPFFTGPEVDVATAAAQTPPGLLKIFLGRLLLGLPVVGAISLVQMLLTMPFLGPVHWMARYRGNHSRRQQDTRDFAAVVLVALLLVGAARVLFKVYELTQTQTRRLLLHAEDAILEVN